MSKNNDLLDDNIFVVGSLLVTSVWIIGCEATINVVVSNNGTSVVAIEGKVVN